MATEKYIEAEFYQSFKKIRNKFRKFDPVNLLELCYNFLNKPASSQLSEMEKMPWHVMLLIKWILKDEQFDIPRRKIPTDSDLILLLNMMRTIDPIPLEPFKFHLVLRVLPYQQFFYQTGFDFSSFSRQIILFEELPDNHYIKTSFKKQLVLVLKAS